MVAVGPRWLRFHVGAGGPGVLNRSRAGVLVPAAAAAQGEEVMNDMRTITIQADGGPGGNDDVMRGALRYIVTTMPVSEKGFKFDGGLHDGTIVNHRISGEWVVSFRPIGDDPARRRTYTDPDAVVRAIIERRHNND